jgi:glycerol-3-phosphate dehydrogenase
VNQNKKREAALSKGSVAVGEPVQKADVVVVGGGCNGTGLLRDLSMRGLKVVLCEKGDLARGATGASSGMIHGGPRYLLTDVETTRHSCEDSGYIQKIVPHILFRVPFLMPVFRNNPYGPLGMLLHDVYFDVYDRYSGLKNGIPHARLTPDQLRALEPGLHGDFLGGVTLDEWGIDPGRLCVLNARDACARGATVRTYTEVVGLLKDPSGAVTGARVRRAGQAQVEHIEAPVVVNCAGPWADKMAQGGDSGNLKTRLRPGKGVHLIYEKRLTNFAIATEAVDGRQVFLMPYQNETWVGTTDDDYYGDLDDLSATQDEVAYLQEAAARLLPGIAQQRLIGTRVGVRNTLYGWGQSEDDLSRRYAVVDHGGRGVKGFYSLTGGKLASYRIQAAEAADLICAQLGVESACETHRHALPGGDSQPQAQDLARQYGIDALAARRLIFRHGSLAPAVLDVGRESRTGYARIDCAEPTLECEVRFCIRHEYVQRLGDLMMRCRIAMGADMGLGCGLRAAQIFAEERGLDVTDERAALMDLLGRRWRSARPVLSGQQLAQAEALMAQYTGLWKLPSQVPYA